MPLVAQPVPLVVLLKLLAVLLAALLKLLLATVVPVQHAVPVVLAARAQLSNFSLNDLRYGEII